MSSEDQPVPRKLKFKITTKGIRSISEDKSCESTVKVAENNGQRNRVTGGVSKFPEALVSTEQFMPVNSSKRKPEISLDDQRGKKRKMDRNLKLQCGNILKELMKHPLGWIFNEPVDPVKLSIPDYFSIITKPMDLGTIKHKLEGNMYFAVEEFAADVNLTFSNAMLYNAPGEEVHKLAKKLDATFTRRWKSFEVKLKHGNLNVEEYRSKNNDQDSKKTVGNNLHDAKAPLRIKLGTCGPMPFEEKRKFTLEFMQVKPSQMKLNVCPSLKKPVQKGIEWQILLMMFIIGLELCNRSACASANQRQSIDSTETKCSSCGSMTCHCRLKTGSAQASTSDLSSERSSEQGHCGWTSLNVQMSPTKALRAALLKSRFAETIFKATHQTKLDHVEKSDPLRMQKERKRLEKEQLEEKARIEAEIKAAEAAARRREHDDIKMRRERERAAARKALQQMEKTVEIDENVYILKDLERLCCGSPCGLSCGDCCEGVKAGFHFGNPLEQLGLYIKDDYDYLRDEDVVLSGVGEEDEDSVLIARAGDEDSVLIARAGDEDSILIGEEGEILQ
ncbi:hypothetical protein MIMGU_mgv1a003834mg [Erythranthe guttata]|uniref:Bromo domain-containing protein n=1 Tax=Erythranthe guttata TaxID=4155 RepID=A0A022QKP4_ERYGU|nr:hypothetical protein MIMGU_mgv1a003834mg [Erythranthe guttata]